MAAAARAAAPAHPDGSRMDLQLVTVNLLNPPVLFFGLGLLAILLRSDLEIPPPIPKALSLYLLFAIGFRGGVELHESGLTQTVATSLAAAMAMAVVVPVCAYFVLRRRLDVYNAAAVAATYGSVSVVTFVAAAAYLEKLQIPFGGHMVAAMALMESPAIVVAVLLVRADATGRPGGGLKWGGLARDALFNGSVFLLLGSLAIGTLTGERGGAALRPFVDDLFKGALCFFLLEMGLVAGRQIHQLRTAGVFLLAFALIAPLVNGTAGLALARFVGMGVGDAVMFTVLCASASYIAVPAALRLAIPQANPSLYVSMSLAITFPFNLVFGIPLYTAIVRKLWYGGTG